MHFTIQYSAQCALGVYVLGSVFPWVIFDISTYFPSISGSHTGLGCIWTCSANGLLLMDHFQTLLFFNENPSFALVSGHWRRENPCLVYLFHRQTSHLLKGKCHIRAVFWRYPRHWKLSGSIQQVSETGDFCRSPEWWKHWFAG